MKLIEDQELLDYYLEMTRFEDFFSFPIRDVVQLYVAQEKEDILKEGAFPGKVFYYLVEGRAKIFCTLSHGKSSLIDFIGPHSFLGELEFLSVRKTSMGVKALTQCYLLAIPVDTYREKLLVDPKFLRRLSLKLAVKEEQRVSLILRTQGFPLANRLAHFILISSTDSVYSELHTDASAYLGVSYRHFIQVLKDFIEDGLIVKEQASYKIVGYESLFALAQVLEME